MNKPILAGLVSVAFLVGGCDDGTPTATNTNQGNPINRLSETPSSLHGRSAARGRDVARQVEASQDQAVGIAGQMSGEARAVAVGGLEFSAPTVWQDTTPRNQMQTKALLVAPDEGDGEALVAFFAGIKGNVASNVERWKGQVKSEGGSSADASVVKQTAGGVPVTLVSSEGIYQEMGGATRPNFGFRGAIVETPQGLVFVRLTGPREKVREAEAQWKAMVLGLRKQ